MRRALLILAVCALLPVGARAATDDTQPVPPLPPHWVFVLNIHHGFRLTWVGDKYDIGIEVWV